MALHHTFSLAANMWSGEALSREQKLALPCLGLSRAAGPTGGRGRSKSKTDNFLRDAADDYSPRWRPLCKKGLIEKRYDTQGNVLTRSGWSSRQQTVWFVTPLGVSMLRWKEMGL